MVSAISSATDRFFCQLFCAFTLPKNLKNKNFEKKEQKTPGDIIILHECTKDHDHILSCSEILPVTDVIVIFSFWAIFCPFTPLTA